MNPDETKLVGEIMNRHIVSVALEDSFDKVITTLQTYHLSCVPVLDQTGRCFGVLSTKDVLRKTKEIEKAQLKSAWELCTYKAIEVEADTPLDAAANLLIENHVHHLVVKDGGAVVGIVSALDLVSSLIGARNLKAH